MNTWEYKTIKLATKGFVGGKLNIEELDSEMNRLGSEGWELVNALDTNMIDGTTRDVVCIFKKQI